MKIVILTEGGINIGLGHIARCTAIDEAFRKRNIIPEWILNADESFVRKNVLLVDWPEDRKRILDKIRNADVAILDSYLLDRSFYADLSNAVKIPVYLDDNIRLDYPRGIIVNGSIGAEAFNYPRSQDKKYLLGAEYIPLRSEFWEVEDKKINKDIKNILVTFGGDDSKEMTIATLKILKEHYPQCIKNVVVGKSFKKKHDIEALKDPQINLIFAADARAMKELMIQSDVAICAGGQTLYELARVGIPTVAVAVADNQKNNIEGWSKEGFIEFAGWWHAVNLSEKILQKIQTLLPYDARLKYKAIGRGIVDGKGAQRIVNNLLSV